MNPEAEPAPRNWAPKGAVTITMTRNSGGLWEVMVPGDRMRIACEALDDARRVAYLWVAHARSCELIVCDAAYGIIDHELFDGALATSSPPSARAPGQTSRERVGRESRPRARERMAHPTDPRTAASGFQESTHRSRQE